MHSYENRSQIRALRTVFTRDEVPEVPELEALVQPGELRGEAGRLVYVQAHDLHLRRDHAIVRGEAAPGVTTQLAAVGLAIEPKVLALRVVYDRFNFHMAISLTREDPRGNQRGAKLSTKGLQRAAAHLYTSTRKDVRK